MSSAATIAAGYFLTSASAVPSWMPGLACNLPLRRWRHEPIPKSHLREGQLGLHKSWTCSQPHGPYAVDRLLRDVAHGKLDIVAARSIDRLGRSLPHVVNLLASLTEQRVGAGRFSRPFAPLMPWSR